MTRICVWNSAVSTSDVALGISREEAQRRALQMLETLGGNGTSRPLSFTEDLPDVLHALVQEMARSDSRSAHYKALLELYGLVGGLAWPRDEFAEKAQLLTHISQLAWSQSLKRGNAAETRRWEEQCLKHFLAQESAPQLLGLPVIDWSPAVCEKFLSDRACLLALWGWLDSRLNSSPRTVFELAFVAYNWLSARYRTDTVSGEEAYLLAQLSCALAGTLRLRGQHSKGREWLNLAEKWCRRSSNSEFLFARIEYLRLAALFDVYQSSRVLVQIASLIEKFEQLGLDNDAAKSKLLQALAHKEVGDKQALTLFLRLKADPAVVRQPWFYGTVLANIAELQNLTGDLRAALCSIKEAQALLLDAGTPFAEAHCYGVAAEILRDNGNPAAAVEYYRRAVEIYLGADIAASAAYVRLILAETLVATGRAEEAVDEVVAALPIVEREKLVREGIAAVGLLKASISLRRPDAKALKALRESLDRARQEAEP